MKIAATVTTALIVAAVAPVAVSGFANPATKIASGVRTATTLHGYLDDLSKELYQPVDQPEGDDSHQATDLDKKQVDRYGVGNWNDYVEFDEFDGGDGQMGVAGDGNKVSQKQRQKERERERDGKEWRREEGKEWRTDFSLRTILSTQICLCQSMRCRVGDCTGMYLDTHSYVLSLSPLSLFPPSPHLFDSLAASTCLVFV